MSTTFPSDYLAPDALADIGDDRLIIDTLTDQAVFMLDDSGVIQKWYAGAKASLGYEATEVIGLQVWNFVAADSLDSSTIGETLNSVREQEKYKTEGWCVRKDGSRYHAEVAITTLRNRDEDHRGFAVAIRSIERRGDGARAIDSDAVDSNNKDSDRIAAFIDMLAHELRNPLAPIANAIAILDRMPDLNEKVLRVRDIVVRQSKHMTQLIDGLLDMSRISDGKVELDNRPVRLDAVIAEAVELVESFIQTQSHTLIIERCSETVWISGDNTRLIQIVSNLLHNAAEFTPQCGTIRIGLRIETDGEKNMAVITVVDNGLGIDPQRIPSLFNRFEYREIDAVRTFGGLGLGLGLAQKLIQLHGGTISAQSTGVNGEGSTFTIRLPRIAGAVEETQPQSSNATKTVLVVDDNRDSALVVAMLLETMGYQCRTAYSGRDAVEAVAKERPSIALLDIGLPDIDGYEVARRITAEMVNPPPLIALTGYGRTEDRDRSLKAGFQAHLVKPVDADKLQMLLHTILAD